MFRIAKTGFYNHLKNVRVIKISNTIFSQKRSCKRFNSNSVPPSTASPEHVPPFLVRVSLIGTAVGLATPLFATAGVARIWTTVLPKTDLGRLFKGSVGLILGGGILKITWDYVIPFFRNNSVFVVSLKSM